MATTTKLDRAFVRDLAVGPNDAQIAQAIIALAHNLSISVIAEGVEERAQLTRLVSYGCDEMQGFLFSPPVPADEFAQMLAEERCLDLETWPSATCL